MRFVAGFNRATAPDMRRLRSARQRETLAALTMAILLSGCASSSLVNGGGLSSYDGLTQSDGKITKSRLHVKKEQVMMAKTINIAPTHFSATAAPTLTNAQRALVANAVDRALCINLSDRFTVVDAGTPADLSVRASITQATPTDEIAAGVSAATSIGTKFVDMGVPVPIPRVPIGMGNLSIEAEAVDPTGQQQAAMLWGRGATAFFSSPKVSKASDAYDLAAEFGEDFGQLLVKGESPFKGTGLKLPSWQKIGSGVGLAPKHKACENFGRSPGVAGFVAGKLGMPPEWMDKGATPTP